MIHPAAIKGIKGRGPGINLVEKYALAEKYTVEERKASSFKILCQRPDPLSIEDAKKLGAVTVNKAYTESENICSTPGARLEHAASSSLPLIKSAGTVVLQAADTHSIYTIKNVHTSYLQQSQQRCNNAG